MALPAWGLPFNSLATETVYNLFELFCIMRKKMDSIISAFSLDLIYG